MTDTPTPPGWHRFPAPPSLTKVLSAYFEQGSWVMEDRFVRDDGHTIDSESRNNNRDRFWCGPPSLPTGTPSDWGFSDD